MLRTIDTDTEAQTQTKASRSAPVRSDTPARRQAFSHTLETPDLLRRIQVCTAAPRAPLTPVIVH